MKLTQRPLFVLLGSIFVLAALAYGLAAAAIGRPIVIRDAFAYNASAQRLVLTGTYEYNPDVASSPREATPGAFTMPGYTLMLSGAYLLRPPAGTTAEAILAVQGGIIVLQLLLAAGSAVMIAFAGHRIGGLRLGWTAGLLAVAYVPFGMNATVMLTETLALFLMTLLLAACVELLRTRAADVPHRHRLAAAIGVLGGLSTLVRPTVALWLVVPFATYAWMHRDRFMGAVKLAAVALASFALVMSPWVIRNAISLDRFVPLMNSSSTPLLDSVGGATFTAAEEQTIAQAEREGRDPRLAVALERLRERWRNSPSGFVAWKLGTLWTGVSTFANLPLDVLIDIQSSGMPAEGAYADAGSFLPRSDSFYSGLFAAMNVYHRILLLLALVGVVIGRRRAVVWVLASVPLYYAVVHTVILFMVRYFYPAIPAIIMLAAFGLVGAWHLAQTALTSGRNTDEVIEAEPAS